ncbi:MAG TPA: peptide chain release factor 3 [Nitrospiraceae bacterium]|nr:peptide chain release factor 3 [Nitrospiraceae bacterium]
MSLPIENSSAEVLPREVLRRRTFAIISHPDAGKTTLTEKLLLYAGAVHLAGAVQARSHQRRATSDWMELEQARGISITSTMLQFDYQGARVNLLDTPGHQDFSEDTYRTLMAVDSAVMVLDGAKGIEPQTKKLFAVCRRRGIPILTFINKMDLPGRQPFDLLDEIERTLGMTAVPFNWPIGEGASFQGLYDLRERQVLFFERTAHNQRRAPMQIDTFPHPRLAEKLGDAYGPLQEEIGLLTGAGTSFDHTRFLAGELTPVFFGSALTNFGVGPFLDAFIHLAPPPGPRPSTQGQVRPTDEAFSGFVFKIQANMDPQHRDRMAFLRICSGRFEKDMMVYHPRLGRKIRMTRPHRLFGRDRETIEEAFPGDVVGLVNPGLFAIGDTLCVSGSLAFDPIPHFPPECFGVLRTQDISKYKQFQKGLQQLEEEGVMQIFFSPDHVRREPILAAVGELQFDVVVSRLQSEYGVKTSVERLPHTLAQWISGDARKIADAYWPADTLRLVDRSGHQVMLFPSEHLLAYCIKSNPSVEFRPAPPDETSTATDGAPIFSS